MDKVGLMKIGIDASRALRECKTGTEWYSQNIILNLAKIDHKNEYILYSHKEPSSPLDSLPSNFKWRVMPFFRGWTFFRLTFEMAVNPPDILFIPAHTLPLITPKKSIVMIHDLGFLHHPSLYPLRQKAYHKFVIWHDKRKATHFLTPSQFTKNDLVETLAIPSDKISVVYHGFDANLYKKVNANNHLSVKYKPYLFYLGRLETKKNIVGLISAFEVYKKRNPKSSLKLVLAGKPGHGYSHIQNQIEKLKKYKKDVVEIGYVKEDEVPKWFSNAEAFVFPSFFEGFGLPVIEAMACGCPVICSNTSSLPEIGSDAAVYFNPKNPDEIANQIKRVVHNKNFRNKLVGKGLQNVKRFSWEKCAKETLSIINKIMRDE